MLGSAPGARMHIADAWNDMTAVLSVHARICSAGRWCCHDGGLHSANTALRHTMDPYQFSAATYKSRIFSGDGALRHLRPQLARLNVRRPLVLCSPSVARHQPLMERFVSPTGDS